MHLILKIFTDIDTVLEAYYRNNSDATAPQDIALTKIDRSAYSATPNKLAKGTPSQYYVERKINPSIFFYIQHQVQMYLMLQHQVIFNFVFII